MNGLIISIVEIILGVGLIILNNTGNHSTVSYVGAGILIGMGVKGLIWLN
jgi:hypothetical protein